LLESSAQIRLHNWRFPYFMPREPFWFSGFLLDKDADYCWPEFHLPRTEALRGFIMDTIHTEKPFFPARRSLRSWQAYLVPVSLVLALILWELFVRVAKTPPFILPSPGLVWARFWQVIRDGSLLRHSLITLFEVLAGLALGVIAATCLGYLLAKSRVIERLLSPYIVASQAVPIVAVAPLLVIWCPPGLLSKVLICALIVFFPVLVNTMVGLRSVPEELRDLMRSLQASRWQTLSLLEMPAALPAFLGGLRIGATLAVIGAVVGEFVGADRGLGFMINLARGQFDTALVFVAALTLVAMALVLYGLVTLLEARLLSWRERPD
jgi:NitT/TauT family transport system permease protein